MCESPFPAVALFGPPIINDKRYDEGLDNPFCCAFCRALNGEGHSFALQSCVSESYKLQYFLRLKSFAGITGGFSRWEPASKAREIFVCVMPSIAPICDSVGHGYSRFVFLTFRHCGQRGLIAVYYAIYFAQYDIVEIGGVS